MEIIVLKAFMFGGHPVQPGSIIDMPAVDAAYAVALKRAEPVTALPEDAAVDAPKAPKTRKAKAA
jgi:hypothetical protein